MDWLLPQTLLLAIPALITLIWVDRRSCHPMQSGRRRALLATRAIMITLALLAIASPARLVESTQQAVVFVLDYSRSEGDTGLLREYEAARTIRSSLPPGVPIGIVASGSEPKLIRYPDTGEIKYEPQSAKEMLEIIGSGTNYERAVKLASGLFPAGTSRHIIIVGDGVETEGSLKDAAKESSMAGIKLHALGVAGTAQPDVRVSRLETSQSRLNEGATLELKATIESSISGLAEVRLFENGVAVDVKNSPIKSGKIHTVSFTRSPEKRKIYNYRVTVEGFEGLDSLPENNEALAIVDVRGKPLFLHVEGEEDQARYLSGAMEKEGIRLETVTSNAFPSSLQRLAGYDGIILSDIAAHRLGDAKMDSIRDYVEKLGGGLIMIGGMNSFGVGGYYRTPIEEILPVKLKSPDQEELQSSALALVMDRSGSMSGQKIEICKSAAIATAELLSQDDYIGIYAFDSQVHEIVPMAKVTSTSAIAGQIALLGSGGGTNIYPGIALARESLNEVNAKIRHMIVLTDGQTSGQGYQTLASQCHAEGITISTVAVGSGAQVGLLQTIAAAGGGQSYITMDPTAITRIFTQDTMTHTGRMIQEEAFDPKLAEFHPMLREWKEDSTPPLLGYVKTNRRATAQVPLVTDKGDPLLAHWRFGLGKVTAFTSDCKTRWAALWVSGWDGYARLWSQILRESARPPQGLNMDLRLEQDGSEVAMLVDLVENAAERKNGASVKAKVFYISASSLGSAMNEVVELDLEQEGPGLYKANFKPKEPGAYLVRARAGSQMVSAGYVFNPSKEVATGKVNEEALKTACELTGGTYLNSSADELKLTGSEVARYIELWPLILLFLLAVFFVDLAIRRWENVMGVIEYLTSLHHVSKG